MVLFDDVLNVLSDEKFHPVANLTFPGFNQRQTDLAIELLLDHGFLRRARQRWPDTWSPIVDGVYISPEMTRFLKRIKELEK